MRGCSPKEVTKGPLNRLDSIMAMADMIQGNEWEWGALSFEIPTDILDKIKAIPIQMFGSKEVTISWKFSQDGEFKSTSAYLLEISNNNQSSSFPGEWVWKMDTLPRICSFLWLFHHNSVPVREIIAN